MNHPNMTNEADPNVTQAASECCADFDQRVRSNPTAAILFAVGAGLAIGVLVRALRPHPTPQNRIMRMLGKLEHRLRDVTAPVLKKASELASDGLEAAQEGGSRAKGVLAAAGRRVRGLFS